MKSLEELLLEGDLDRLQAGMDSLCYSAYEITEALENDSIRHVKDEARHMANVARRMMRDFQAYRRRLGTANASQQSPQASAGGKEN